jgi:outer membrane protein OmpA-like peptidoglycan-associated protein
MHSFSSEHFTMQKWQSRGRFFIGVLGLAILAACAPQPQKGPATNVTLVVLPKPPDGHVGAVMVRPIGGGKPVLVDKPYVEASLRDTKTVRTTRVDPKSIDESFGKTLAALPAQPATFVVQFVEGTDELNPDAKRALDSVVVEVTTRPSPEIAVVGHTDFTGTDEYNDVLSLQRAQRVKELLVKRGIPAKMIQTVGRGKREPLISTAGDKVEPRNRRVEIVVR